MGQPLLSVAIITKNESQNIAECLRSLSFADEIVVLDSRSTDDTKAIAEQFGARVEISTQWDGFGLEKNKAIELCRGDWILSVDADERVSKELQREIAEAITLSSNYVAFAIPRFSSFCGKYIHYSGWRPDYVVRLFKRNHARFSKHLVHESLICDGPVGTLRNSILHESFQNFESVIHKMNIYSTASAIQLADAGRSASPVKALMHGAWAFLRTYIFRLGFLDGYHGLALAISNAEGTYYRYMKLWIISQNNGKKL